jgi:uncharacterized protein
MDRTRTVTGGNTLLDHFSVVVLPGIYGSGSDHWQTIWEVENPSFQRFDPTSWDEPDLHDWVQALSTAVDASPRPVLLLAHSLATLAVAHWGLATKIDDDAVAGAFLVAVPDPAGGNFPLAAASFTSPPQRPLPFPTLMIASDTDPYSSLSFARATAHGWGAELAELQGLGHINSASGLGRWSQGWEMFTTFAGRLAPQERPHGASSA